MNGLTEPLEWSIKQLHEMDAIELYDMLKLRADIFVIEQDCIYADMDDKDKFSIHVFGKKNNVIIACTRIFKAGDYFELASMGRVAVKESERKYGYGHELVRQSIRAIESQYGVQSIKISAQQYLINFYEKHGFKTVGEGYLEDDIPHIGMIRE